MSTFQLQTGFAPGRVHINQEGQLVVPDNASIRYDGGVNALSEKGGEADQPQIGSPTVLRWPISNNTFTFTKVFGFNYYILDAWVIKLGNTGGAGDEIQIGENDQSGDRIIKSIFDLNGVTDGSIVRATQMRLQSLGTVKADIPQSIKIFATKVTDCECTAFLMIMPFLGNRANQLAP